MSVYWVSYDLDKPGQDYTDLINAIHQLGGQRILFSDWLISGNFTAVQIRDHLAQFMDGNDRIFVAGLNGIAAWRNTMLSGDEVKKLLAA